jgi:hypothetical protein
MRAFDPQASIECLDAIGETAEPRPVSALAPPTPSSRISTSG